MEFTNRMEKLECNLSVLGVSGIEDCLQNDVRETIQVTISLSWNDNTIHLVSLYHDSFSMPVELSNG